MSQIRRLNGQAEALSEALDRVTPNFRRSEFACKDGTPYPAEWDDRLRELCNLLETLRAEVGGKPIRIVSAYRTLEYNRKIGSKDTSQHVQGRAADIKVDGMSARDVAEVARRLASQGRIVEGGIGQYSKFVHLDTRGRRARWSGR